MSSGAGGPPRAGGTGSGGLPVPLNLIHTTKSPNPSPARVSGRFQFVGGAPLGDLMETESVPGRTTFQALHLLRLNREFGVDITGAAGLGGPVLDEWIYRAEDDLQGKLMTAYRQQRQGGGDAKT